MRLRSVVSLSAVSLTVCAALAAPSAAAAPVADMIVTNARVTTLDERRPSATALAVRNGRFLAVGDRSTVDRFRGARTRIVNARGRRIVPGLNDVHVHFVSGGASWKAELRWDNVTSLRKALRLVRERAARTPPGQWVRVLGGWSPDQFREARLPTPAELTAAAPNNPVIVTHLWSRAIFNRAGLQAMSITRDTPDPSGGVIERDAAGDPTGVVIAKPDWNVILRLIGRLPRLTPAEQLDSTRRLMREFNRLGLTSVTDGGAGAYPANYQAVETLARRGELTLRIAGTLYPDTPGQEFENLTRWVQTVPVTSRDPFYRIFGAGEIVDYDAFDLANFGEPRPELPPEMEAELRRALTLLRDNGWSFRLHASYDETISRMLDVIEALDRERPFRARWSIEHAETISSRNIERIKRLGGGIGIQNRLYFQGEEFIRRYGAASMRRQAPPVKEMLRRGVPVGAGTDALRVASHNPWLSLYWLVSGRTIGGTRLYAAKDRLTRTQALRLYTRGSAWFSRDERRKGTIRRGRFADFAVLSADFLRIPEERIKRIESALTVVNGDVVHRGAGFRRCHPPGRRPTGRPRCTGAEVPAR